MLSKIICYLEVVLGFHLTCLVYVPYQEKLNGTSF